MEEKDCCICLENSDSFVKTQYGDVCSIGCFRKLCNDIIGASEEDFIVE